MMKRNDNGDFCILYVEPDDDKTSLLQAIVDQKKPVVIMLADQARLFQRPEEFVELKHVKRQRDLTIIFVIPGGGRVTRMANRNGFPAYASMEALVQALASGPLARQHVLSRAPAAEQASQPAAFSPRKTVPLVSEVEIPVPEMRSVSSPKRTAQLTPPTLPPLTPPTLPPLAPSQAARGPIARFPLALVVLLILALAIAGLGSSLMLFHTLPDMAAAPAQAVGHIAFLSSEQVSENSSQGIDDQVLIELNNIPAPASQKSYYAWLLSDNNQADTRVIALGPVSVNGGHIRALYKGDKQHTNLLQIASRFLLTEEDAQVPPVAPSPDQSTWRYYGEFSQNPINIPDNVNHYSYLDHLRHLLAADPTLDQLELPGGLNNWFYQNTSKVLEWSSSTRGPWEDSKDVEYVRRMAVRILDYLDGLSFVAQDVPPGTPVLVNARLASIGLLEVAGPTQDPPSYMDHIVSHLNGLLQSPGATATLHKQAGDIVSVLDNVKAWLTQVRHDAQLLVKMSDDQLRQPGTLSLLNDMLDNATHAFVGQVDPATGKVRGGETWIHTQMQQLATLDILPYVAGKSHIQMIPDMRHATALQSAQKR
ncbi:hypothetical protein EPA93_47240 [Ktedonosporobacter rubrisoli]|uniref:Uncharacterized protein n=1 Tax=Ktedonosporobacter rubrisoli TaxID=2509675 RepID=A0A4P6K4C3_KTERU|nr:hypothetical protein [Ktedonosporobacter rubrisoli]QBD83157.1 hypothetical protein EPA93_47240 [Ktedonosporobacter rubrisoli]